MARRARITASKILTVEEVSSYLRVHPSTVYRLLKRNELPGFRIGGTWRFVAADLDKWRTRIEADFSSAIVYQPVPKQLK
ncbi:MAG: helix-turn-helix domain-containing protein [Candidatus Binataceae bacterium]